MELRGRGAIVTGASSGIGRATAVALARAGCSLVVAARREERLADLAAECRKLGVRCEPVPTDVSDRSACFDLIRRASELLGPIDILVNCAGFALYDRLVEAREEDLRAMMNTNFFGAVRCTQAVLPGMIARRSGAVVNIASTTGIMGFAGMSGYCSTKFAMIGMTEALRDEMMGSGVQVSMICPNTTRTEFFDRAESAKMPGAYRLVLAIPPERVARAVLRAIRQERYRIILPLGAAIYMKYKEILPRPAHFLMRLTSRLLERRTDV